MREMYDPETDSYRAPDDALLAYHEEYELTVKMLRERVREARAKSRDGEEVLVDTGDLDVTRLAVQNALRSVGLVLVKS